MVVKMWQELDGIRLLILLYLISLGFLISVPYTLNYPIDDEVLYITQTHLLMEGKTEPNWRNAYGYVTMLLGMPVVKYAFTFSNLRLLMMIIVSASAPLMYLILREFGAKRDISILGSFVLLTAPYTYLREYITEPISLFLYLLSI